ncbi:uncharacterized protein LOC111122223 [Crassostrea virginica]
MASREGHKRLLPETVQTLECVFTTNAYPRNEELQMIAKKCGENVKRLKTWFNNRRVKARNEFDRKKSKDRRRRKSTGDVTYKKMQQTTTPDWRVEQTIDPSDKRVHHSQKERKRSYRKRSMMYIPHRRPLHPDRAAEDLVMERDAELIDDKEYHEILYDSDW